MPAAKDAIHVQGLREFRNQLKALDGESQKQLRLVMNEAVEIIAADTRRRVPYKSGKTAKSVRVTSSQTEAKVSAGSKKVSWYAWLDFGGQAPGNKKHGKRGKRTFQKEGRYLYKAYRSHREDVLDLLHQGLVDLAKEKGWEVS